MNKFVDNNLIKMDYGTFDINENCLDFTLSDQCFSKTSFTLKDKKKKKILFLLLLSHESESFKRHEHLILYA